MGPSTSRRPPALSSALLLAVLTAGCFEASRESGVILESSLLEIARGTVGPAGGVLTATPDRPGFRAVRLEVPPGALDRDVDIRIRVRFGDPDFPSVVQVFECTPLDLTFATPAALTIQYAEAYREATGTLWPDAEIEGWRTVAGPGLDGVPQTATVRDLEERSLTLRADRLGRFYAMHAPLRQLIHGAPRLLDPATAQPVRQIGGVLVEDPASEVRMSVGAGSLESFFASPAADNLLVVHGAIGNALAMGLPSSLAPPAAGEGFNDDFPNVVVFDYPSGRSLADTGNALYRLLRDGARPGFGCNVIAHSTGGLVVRHAIERAHLDPSRPGARADDPPLDPLIADVVLIGTPNLGTSEIDDVFGDLLAVVPATDARFVQGLLDARPGAAGFVDALNRDWSPPESRYFAIAGDLGGQRSDGVVDVLSVVGLPDTLRRPDAYLVFSGPIYAHTSLAAFGGRTGVVDQARQWFGKVAENARPIVGNLRGPFAETLPNGRRVHRIECAISDPDSDPCFVFLEISVEGGPFFLATPVGQPRQPTLTQGLPAPGRELTLRWDSSTDLRGAAVSPRVQARVFALDPGGPGVPALGGRSPLP